MAYRAIRHTLAHLGLVDEPPPPEVNGHRVAVAGDVIDKRDPADAFARPGQSFDALTEGEVIGTRADGEVMRAPWSGRIVFPNAKAEARQEWYYLARPSTRFA